MTLPLPDYYTRLYDYAGYQNANPTRQLPAVKFNIEFNDVQRAVNDIIDFLAGMTALNESVVDTALASAGAVLYRAQTPTDAEQLVAQTNLGLVIGTDVQAYDADLTTLATNLTAYGATLVATANAGAARTALGLVIGTNVQAHDATLDTVAAATYTGAASITTLGTIATGVWSGTAIALAKGGTGATDASTARTNLGLGSIATQAASAVAITGGTITGMSAPTVSSDVATKLYVDSVGSGISPRAAVALATTANLTRSGEQTIDGTLTSATRILVKDQTATAENGVFVTAAGAWTRATDFDAAGEMTAGAAFLVTGGTLNAGTGWLLAATVATPGVSSATFNQYQSVAGAARISNNLSDLASVATARTNLGLAIGTNVQAFHANLAAVAADTYTGASSITTLGTIATGVWNGTALGAAYGGFGSSVAASSGVPLFAAGVPTFTSTTGTGNFVRALNPTMGDGTGQTYFVVNGGDSGASGGAAGVFHNNGSLHFAWGNENVLFGGGFTQDFIFYLHTANKIKFRIQATEIGAINASGLGLAASSYLNYGATYGSSGYGFRDSGGVLQVKHSGGAWATVSSASPIASGVAFTQTGTGAVARTVDDELKERISITQFGAVSGGSATTNKTALQRAVNRAVAVGGIVRIPAGNFSIDGGITIPAVASPSSVSNLSIEGEGSGASIITFSTTGLGAMFTFGVSGYSGSGFALKGVQLQGPGLGSPASDSSIGLSLVSCAFCFLDDVFIRYFDYGIYGAGLFSCTIDRSWIRLNRRGIHLVEDVAYSYPNNIGLYHTSITDNSLYGAYIGNGSQFNMYGGSVEVNGTTASGTSSWGVKLDDGGDQGTVSGNFYGVYFEGNGGQADIWVAQGSTNSTVNVQGCNFTRLDGTNFTVHNVYLTGGASIFKINLIGNSHWGTGGYSTDAARKYVNNASTNGIVYDAGNQYVHSTEDPGFSDIAVPGYVTLQGGLIQQWGLVLATAAGAAVTFPKAFPTAALTVYLTAKNGGSAVKLSTSAPSTTGFTAYSPDGNADTCWFALGH
jgi:hypothetical protein